ncbi:MAG: hypothetical protein RMM07_11925 [Anaerolineae bacterium]|nr:hypothetical protein [Anaerolineae bacterium]
MTEGDVLLALLLIAGFATLGILITLGNVRQTRAIREVGEVLHGWAIRHIQLSRAVAAASIRVEDPEVWFRETLARVQLRAPAPSSGFATRPCSAGGRAGCSSSMPTTAAAAWSSSIVRSWIPGGWSAAPASPRRCCPPGSCVGPAPWSCPP